MPGMALPAILRDTTQAHLEQLVTDQAQEGPHLDFKRDLPANWDASAKNEFVADVSAFANAGGGDVIFGIAEDGDAKASAVVPQAIRQDQEVRRLLDFLLNSVEPRIPGAQVHAVEVNVGGTGGHAILVRVPRSWVGPHRVKTNQHFYLREGARKRQLDVPEIRGLFLRSESQGQRVRDFRNERLSRILTSEGTPNLAPGAVLVMHLVPSEAALGLMQVDPLAYVPSLRRGARYLPLLARDGAGSPSINLDGALFLRHSGTPGVLPGYAVFFRNGFFEATLVYDSPHKRDSERLNLPSRAYEDACINLVDGFRAELRHLGISTEMTGMLTLLHANRVRLGLPEMDFGWTGQDGLFDRPHVVLPDVQLQADVASDLALKPVFDLLGQACGLAGSPYYDANGKRTAR
jgi:hypothetical protein